MRRTPRTLVVLALGAGLALTPLTAHAQQGRVHDRAGDSSSRATDVTRLRVEHAPHRITATLTIPGLVPRRLSGTELLIRPGHRKKVYAVTVLRDRRGRVVGKSLSWRPLNDPVEPTILPCHGIRTSLRAGHTVVSVATSCLTRSAAHQPIRAKVRTVDGTTGLRRTYYDDQTRFTRSLSARAAERGARAAERGRRPAPVTWQGWRGVGLGSTLASAHDRLGGTLHHSTTSGGCGDVLTTRNGVLDGNVYARPHRVGNISVARAVRYPLGVRAGMRPARVVRRVEQSDYRLHRVTSHDYGSTQHESWVRGPHGHTLYFAYTEGRIYRMGLAVDRQVARGHMEMNGC